MGYREDLVQRLQQEGLWDRFTSHEQTRFQNLTDDQARQMMVMNDQWDLGEQQAVEWFGLVSLVQVIQSFRGALVERQGASVGKLSKAGKLLAEFFIAVEEEGLSADDVATGLQGLSPLGIAALTTVYQRTEQ